MAWQTTLNTFNMSRCCWKPNQDWRRQRRTRSLGTTAACLLLLQLSLGRCCCAGSSSSSSSSSQWWWLSSASGGGDSSGRLHRRDSNNCRGLGIKQTSSPSEMNRHQGRTTVVDVAVRIVVGRDAASFSSSTAALEATAAVSSQQVVHASLPVSSLRGGGFFQTISDRIGANKTSCWILLGLGILAETVAVAMSKHARDIRSTRLFAAASLLYLFW
jgi:hypothetical protein